MKTTLLAGIAALALAVSPALAMTETVGTSHAAPLILASANGVGALQTASSGGVGSLKVASADGVGSLQMNA